MNEQVKPACGRWMRALSITLAAACMGAAQAAPVAWTAWSSGTAGAAGQADGVMTFGGGQQAAVHYEGELRYAYTAGGEHFWNSTPDAYTSAAVDNPPAGSFLQLNRASRKTVSFSHALSGVFLAVLSLNDNHYEFDHDFVVESSGCGLLGCGTLTREVVDGRYRLVAQGEGHGVIRFVGEVSSLSWQTHHAEDWQGVTLGAYGVSPVPEPASVVLSLAGLALISWRLRRSAVWGRSSSGCCLR